MAALVPVLCPHCGAKVEVDREALQADCRYCGTTSWLQRPEAPRRTAPPNTRIIVMPPVGPPRSSAAPLAITLVLVGLLVAGAAVALMTIRKSAVVDQGDEPPKGRSAKPTKAGARAAQSLDFQSVARPLVVDVNRDGTEDLLVREGSNSLLAVNGKGGPPLWKLEGTGGARGYQSFSYLADSRLAIVESVDLQLIDVATGKIERKISLDDKAVLPCIAPAGTLRILLASDEVAKVDLKTGATSLEAKGAPCDEAASNLADRSRANARRTHPIGFLPADLQALRCGGISVTGTYTYSVPDPCAPQLGRLDEGSDAIDADAAVPMPGGHIVLGSRGRGRRVGVVGRVEKKRLVWLENASSAEAGEQVEGKLTRVAISVDQVAVIAGKPGGERLTSFEAKTGKRLLDVKLANDAVWLTSANRQWVVTMAKQIAVVGADGKLTPLYE